MLLLLVINVDIYLYHYLIITLVPTIAICSFSFLAKIIVLVRISFIVSWGGCLNVNLIYCLGFFCCLIHVDHHIMLLGWLISILLISISKVRLMVVIRWPILWILLFRNSSSLFCSWLRFDLINEILFWIKMLCWLLFWYIILFKSTLSQFWRQICFHFLKLFIILYETIFIVLICRYFFRRYLCWIMVLFWICNQVQSPMLPWSCSINRFWSWRRQWRF